MKTSKKFLIIILVFASQASFANELSSSSVFHLKDGVLLLVFLIIAFAFKIGRTLFSRN